VHIILMFCCPLDLDRLHPLNHRQCTVRSRGRPAEIPQGAATHACTCIISTSVLCCQCSSTAATACNAACSGEQSMSTTGCMEIDEIHACVATHTRAGCSSRASRCTCTARLRGRSIGSDRTAEATQHGEQHSLRPN
jgi:hypothetical protein